MDAERGLSPVAVRGPVRRRRYRVQPQDAGLASLPCPGARDAAATGFVILLFARVWGAGSDEIVLGERWIWATQANPESRVGVLAMASRGPGVNVIVTPTDDVGKVLARMHGTRNPNVSLDRSCKLFVAESIKFKLYGSSCDYMSLDYQANLRQFGDASSILVVQGNIKRCYSVNITAMLLVQQCSAYCCPYIYVRRGSYS